MDWVNKEVIHQAFGRGNVVDCDDSYIEINFESGDKRFVFPDIFKKHISFVDQKASELVEIKINKKKEKLKEKEIIREEERDLETERRYIMEQQKRMKNSKVHSKIQSVFWCESEDEEERVFEEWRVFTGEIKSGNKKGQPRKLARLNQNSACLITSRRDDMKEGDRKILGAFMTNPGFNGRTCENGYITAHPEYRIQLSEEEAEKMFFWNYYLDINDSDATVWNSGRQRYFDNKWMAQILRDIMYLKKDPQEKEDIQNFFEYFCKMNAINKNELSNANGALMRD